MITLLDPSLSVTGHGIFLSDEYLMFIGSICCNYPMNRATHLAGRDDGTHPYSCMNCDTVVYGYYDSAANLVRNPTEDHSDIDWALDGWANSWTGIEDIQVNITYM